ncbi:hypothetical protein [Bosea sp. RAC05]|uniref:hypothetical protein n=1 Tax=Bosea sp. RAC05 TaxID=1842539 RepID=UPI00083CC165|nr:hypothetical protein [Bosea sp. RAC05]AOG02804.1 hypothetical protein BSY19_5005 [Bosea sp. RAC05]
MPIGDLSNEQLNNLENNYLKAKKTEGAIYSLSEVRIEKLRRMPNPFGVRESTAKIIELAQASPDGLTTYGELWNAFRPNDPWKGNASGRIMSQALGRVAAYCIDNKLPIITTLVVRSNSKKLAAEAIDHIFEFAQGLGVDTGSDPNAFIAEQTEGARKLTKENLPPA